MKANLVYISGYATKGEDYDDTYCYYEKYGSYFSSLDRGGFTVSQDSACQWGIFFFCIIFDVIKTNICRRSLTSVFQQVSDAYNLHREERQSVALENILINNFCKASIPFLRKRSRVEGD